MKIFFVLVIFSIQSVIVYGQFIAAPIDTVLSFLPGRGQNIGQDSIYFPKNIFNLPRKTISETVPESDPNYLCSIGLGGEIIVGWKNFELIDLEGDDLIVFENAFVNPVTKKIFAEPATISVSQDGITFIDFPFDFQTLQGCAGTKPTNGGANPFDPLSCGGNSFDLSSIGIRRIKYIKIKDLCDSILLFENHPYYDPILSGFDLDCVVGLHLIPLANNQIERRISNIKILNSSSKILIMLFDAKATAQLFDNSGGIIDLIYFEDTIEIDFSILPNSLYFILLVSEEKSCLIKVIKWNESIFYWY